MSSNPALHTNCEVLKEVIPGVVTETLGEAPTQPPGPSNRPLCLPNLSPSSDIHKPSSPAPERLHGNPTLCSGPHLPAKVMPAHASPQPLAHPSAP